MDKSSVRRATAGAAVPSAVLLSHIFEWCGDGLFAASPGKVGGVNFCRRTC
mgnify:CR=1 FL=1